MMKNDKVLVALFVVLLVTFVFLYRKNMGYSWDKFSPNMPKVNNVVKKEIEAAKKKAEEVETEEPVVTKVEPEVKSRICNCFRTCNCREPVTNKVEPVTSKQNLKSLK